MNRPADDGRASGNRGCAVGTAAALQGGMTAPRWLLPGNTYLVTRRCAQRQFLLAPSETTNQIFMFSLAVAARAYGIQVHAVCVMSDHVHIVLTDPDARLPLFAQRLNSMVARAVNSSLGRWEAFWSPSSYSAVLLVSPQDVVEKIAYVLANPVSAGLVRTGRLWPGIWSDPDAIGGDVVEVSRPTQFFSPKGSTPARAAIGFVVPKGFDSVTEFRERVGEALARLEDEAAARFGRGFQGVARVLKLKPHSRPSTVEPRRNLNPRVAARSATQRIEVLAQLVEFRRSYRSAWADRRDGKRDVVFPAGTYLLRVAHGVRCAAPG